MVGVGAPRPAKVRALERFRRGDHDLLGRASGALHLAHGLLRHHAPDKPAVVAQRSEMSGRGQAQAVAEPEARLEPQGLRFHVSGNVLAGHGG